MSAASDLTLALRAGSYLIDSPSTPQPDLKSALLKRLQAYYQCLGSSFDIDDSATVETIQIKTADEALYVVEKAQTVLEAADAVKSSIPLLGTRDLNQLRTLLSITFRWGVDALLSLVISSWPNTYSTSGPRIIDLTSTPDNFYHLSNLVSRQLSLIFPEGVRGSVSNTLITEIIFQKHIADILKPAIALGWLPKSYANETMIPLDQARPLVMRLVELQPPAEAILALGNIISSNSVPHIRRVCGSLMTRQLLRTEGVKGLCAAVFGDSEKVDDVQLDKLQHVAQLLGTAPTGLKPEEYFIKTVPRIMALLRDHLHPAYRRAAAFTLSEMLTGSRSAAAKFILSELHHPFLYPGSNVTVALNDLAVLLANSDPSPQLVSSLLSPIVLSLYSLLFYLDSVRTSDPELRESARSLLVTWARIVSTGVAIDNLWSVFDEGPGQWQSDLKGNIQRSSGPKHSDKLTLFTPEDLKKAENAGDLDTWANIFDHYPDPRHLTAFLVANEKGSEDGNPLRTFLYLQLILQMQNEILDGPKSANLFSKPTQILNFIKQALETTLVSASTLISRKGKSKANAEIRISNRHSNTEGEDDLADEGDSDDDLSDSEAFTAEHEIQETTVTLLLSVLEVNENLSARTEPVLNEIFEALDALVHKAPSAVRAVAREARMVMTARLALSSNTAHRVSNKKGDHPQEVYQKALKLLQDPILPVRAHGLLLLRQLVSSDSKELDSALIPAILEIFLQSVQDDDSYIFLNAVQGLAALVDKFDRRILSRLIHEYTSQLSGLETTNMTQQDIDIRIRLGEALSMVIRRCGEILGTNASSIIPPLLQVVRSGTVPTIIRTSALSLLSDCQNTYALALHPHFVDLAEGMVDLLQVEATPPRSISSAKDALPLMMDNNPTSSNSKLPPLRRAAIHFLSILIRSLTKEAYELFGDTQVLSTELSKRMRITLEYIASTDVDRLVRVMAREASEDLVQLERAKLGL
ncbi:hypothetical protein D9757_000047 [Collybiopsis confluens]|uniref:RNA polymerase II assembly factor Rtp1 C-terminal domain-containing protein n=1 Tax=Collybiopsis confluens TaxID=2823264 RepID=A0A8H5MHE4_9AGAR|nr:hypothetical protein D9757_000047 [Collybiopsis confluens]